MKHIKYFELYTADDNLKFGNFVICTDTINYQVDDNSQHDAYINFLNTNIGTFVGMNKNEIYNHNIVYENIPKKIEDYFDTRSTKYNINENAVIFKASREDILHYSDKKEDLEPYIAQNKFNL